MHIEHTDVHLSSLPTPLIQLSAVQWPGSQLPACLSYELGDKEQKQEAKRELKRLKAAKNYRVEQQMWH